MKTKITNKSILTLTRELQGKSTYVWDTELSGFGIYLTPKGDISWLVQKWIGGRGGRAVRHAIGRTKDGMELQEARSLAAASIGEIHKGIDLADQKRKQRQSVRDDIQSIKVREALNRYLETHQGTGRYRDEMEKNLRAAFESHAKTPLKAITKADIRDIIDSKNGMGARRNLFSALRPFFNWALEHDLITSSPVANITPPAPLKSRDRLLSRQEIKAMWVASYHLPDRWGAFYRLLLLTGQRREEVAGMHSSEIEFDKGIWTVPADRAKNGKAHIVHLSSMALSELSQSQGYVFPASRVRLKSEKSEAHISGYSKMKTKLDDLMTMELAKGGILFSAWRVHDFRRTMASNLAEQGFPTDVVDRLLNHVSGSQAGVKGVYQRYNFIKERQEALKVWASLVEKFTATDVQ